MDCSTIINSFSVIVTVLSVFVVIVLGWQLWKIRGIKKEIRNVAQEEILKERAAMSAQLSELIKISTETTRISKGDTSSIYAHIFEICLKMKDYDLAIQSLSMSIRAYVNSITEQDEFRVLANVDDLILQISTEKAENVTLLTRTIDLFIESVCLIKSKGYANDSLDVLKRLLYKFAK